MKVNHVWYGDNALGPLELFNIYSWLALGHEVTIYAHKWDGSDHNAGSLKVDSAVKIKSLDTILTKDDEKEKSALMPNTRALLKAWIAATNKKKPDTDLIFNLVDVTKSYIGGTRQGIVLDLKAGPSKHLASDYEAVFGKKFISYTRGGNTVLPENQCMGTMDGEKSAIRGKYAAYFESKVTKSLEDFTKNPTKAWFGLITVFHGEAFRATGAGIDVATQAPGGAKLKADQFVVEEIGEPSHGPFRIFKHKADQTNKSGSIKTKPADIADLAQKTYDKELKVASGVKDAFLKKAEAAMKTLPEWKAPKPKEKCEACGLEVANMKAHKFECKGKK